MFAYCNLSINKHSKEISHKPAKKWGNGPSGKFAIAKELIKWEYPAQAVVDIDSMIVDAIFGQHGEKKKIGRVHKVLSLSTRSDLSTPATRQAIRVAFEKIKERLDFKDHKAYIAAAQELARDLAKQDPLINAYEGLGTEIATWCAYFVFHIR